MSHPGKDQLADDMSAVEPGKLVDEVQQHCHLSNWQFSNNCVYANIHSAQYQHFADSQSQAMRWPQSVFSSVFNLWHFENGTVFKRFWWARFAAKHQF